MAPSRSPGDIGLAPALGAFGDDHAPAFADERHGGQRAGHGGGRGGLALQQLHTGGSPTLGFGQRPQPGAPLGKRAVVVAVDEIGGLQGGSHGCGPLSARRS